MKLRVRPGRPLLGTLHIPGDKSIAHRALLLGCIAEGVTRIRRFLAADVCLTTLRLMRALGVEVDEPARDELYVHGVGLHGLQEPENVLDCGGSGTTLRLLCGILAGQSFATFVTGSPRLRSRPMARIVEPLRKMGATVLGRNNGAFAPLAIQGGSLTGSHHDLAVASAQVKSCILLAGLYCFGSTSLREPAPSRDHTERMLTAMGCAVESFDGGVRLEGRPLRPLDIVIPGDLSSAAFAIVAATLVPGSSVQMPDVGVNPGRVGIVEVLQAAGASIKLTNVEDWNLEPVARLSVESARLSAMQIGGSLVPRMIDEFPILAVAATQAQGRTIIADAAELRVKESDRVATTAGELRKLGARIEERADGFVVIGPTPLYGTTVHSHQDHRLAMALAVAGLVADGETIVEAADCIADSYPDFVQALRTIGADCEML